MTSERIGGLLFLALSILYGWGATRIPSLPIDEFEAMTARTLPYTLAGLGVLLSLVLLIRGGGSDSGAGEHARGDWATVLMLVAAAVVYALLLDWLGFLLCTGAFLAAGFFILGERRLPALLGLPALLVGGLWLMLVAVLDIYLAPGRLFTGLVG